MPVRYAVSVTQTIYGSVDEFVAQMLGPLRETVEDLVSYVDYYGFS